MTAKEKPLVWLHGQVKTPPFSDAIVILDVFAKQSRETPREVIDTCKLRLKRYDSVR